MKVVYKCNYDGKTCNKEIPVLDSEGFVIKPKEIDKSKIGFSEHCTCWKSCVDCKRNHSMSVAPCGSIVIQN